PALNWQIAGLASVEGGSMGTEPIPFSWRVRPESAWVEDGRLHVRNGDFATAGVPSSGGMLDAFVKIATHEDVARFAVRWGTLGICAHNLPASHTASYLPTFSPSIFATAPGEANAYLTCYQRTQDGEPVERWLDYIRAARSILNIAAALHTGSLGAGEDW